MMPSSNNVWRSPCTGLTVAVLVAVLVGEGSGVAVSVADGMVVAVGAGGGVGVSVLATGRVAVGLILALSPDIVEQAVRIRINIGSKIINKVGVEGISSDRNDSEK